LRRYGRRKSDGTSDDDRRHLSKLYGPTTS